MLQTFLSKKGVFSQDDLRQWQDFQGRGEDGEDYGGRFSSNGLLQYSWDPVEVQCGESTVVGRDIEENGTECLEVSDSGKCTVSRKRNC